jgi:hypothetical protein
MYVQTSLTVVTYNRQNIFIEQATDLSRLNSFRTIGFFRE